jgi:cytochrome c oxidase subunit 4
MSGKEHHIVTPATYIKVLISLMVLMFLTIWVAKSPTFDYGEPINVILALVIAFAKMLLIMMFFMHVKFSSKLTQVFAFTGLFFLLILFSLTFNDYLTRWWWHAPFTVSPYGG